MMIPVKDIRCITKKDKEEKEKKMKKETKKKVDLTPLYIKEDELVAKEISTLKYLSYHIPGDVRPIPDNFYSLSDVTLLTNNIIKLEDDRKEIFYIAYYDAYVNLQTVLGNLPNAIIVFKDNLSDYDRNKALIITGEKLQYKTENGKEVIASVDQNNFNNFNNLKQLIKAFHGYKSSSKKVCTMKNIVSCLSSVIKERYKGEYNYENHVSVKFNFGYLASDGMLEPIHKDMYNIHNSTIEEFIPKVRSSNIQAETVSYARGYVRFFNGVKVKADDQGKDILGLTRMHLNLRINKNLRPDIAGTNANFLTVLFRDMSKNLRSLGMKPDVENMLNLVDTYTDNNELKLTKEFIGEFLGKKYTKLVEISLKTFNPNGCYIRSQYGDQGWFFIMRVIINPDQGNDEQNWYPESTVWVLPIGRISVSLMSDERKGEFTIEKLANHVYESELRSCIVDNEFAGHAIAKISEVNTMEGKGARYGVHSVEILDIKGIREFLKELKKYFSGDEIEVETQWV